MAPIYIQRFWGFLSIGFTVGYHTSMCCSTNFLGWNGGDDFSTLVEVDSSPFHPLVNHKDCHQSAVSQGSLFIIFTEIMRYLLPPQNFVAAPISIIFIADYIKQSTCLLLKSSFLATQSTIHCQFKPTFDWFNPKLWWPNPEQLPPKPSFCGFFFKVAAVSAGPRRFADLVATQVKTAMEERVISWWGDECPWNMSYLFISGFV